MAGWTAAARRGVYVESTTRSRVQARSECTASPALMSSGSAANGDPQSLPSPDPSSPDPPSAPCPAAGAQPRPEEIEAVVRRLISEGNPGEMSVTKIR